LGVLLKELWISMSSRKIFLLSKPISKGLVQLILQCCGVLATKVHSGLFSFLAKYDIMKNSEVSVDDIMITGDDSMEFKS